MTVLEVANKIEFNWTIAALKEVVGIFFDEYVRAPSKKEFDQLTGCTKHVSSIYGGYKEFLESIGYKLTKKKTYTVINSRNMVVFVGIYDDIAEEFGMSMTRLSRVMNEGGVFNEEFRVILKYFNEDAISGRIILEVLNNNITKQNCLNALKVLNSPSSNQKRKENTELLKMLIDDYFLIKAKGD